jgi:hypothetical protein
MSIFKKPTNPPQHHPADPADRQLDLIGHEENIANIGMRRNALRLLTPYDGPRSALHRLPIG